MARILPSPSSDDVLDRTLDVHRRTPLSLLAIVLSIMVVQIAPLFVFAQTTTSGGASRAPDTLRHFIAPSQYHHVTAPNVVQLVERFEISDPVAVTAVSITLAGGDSAGSCRVRFYGVEGGAPVPRWGREIASPVAIHKTRFGAQTIRLVLPTPIRALPPQFFVAVDNLSPGTVLICDRVERPPMCVAFEDTFGLQALKMRDGSWRRFPFAFHISLEVERLIADGEPWFTPLTGTPEAFDSLMPNRSIAWADVDNNRFQDLLVGGRLWRNVDGHRFEEVPLGPSTPRGPLLNLFLDADKDGDPDILLAGYPGEGDRAIRYLENDNGDFRSTETIPVVVDAPTAFCVHDLDGNHYPDILIASDAASAQGLLYLRNLDGRGFTDASSELPRDVVACRLRGVRCVDIDGDGRAELAALDTAGRWLYWSIPLSANSTMSLLASRDAALARGRVYAGDWGDLDGDQAPEILLGASAQRSRDEGRASVSAVAINAGPAPAGAGGTLALGSPAERRGGIAMADIDNDGRSEILLLTTRSCHPATLLRMNDSGLWDDVTWRAGLAGRSIGPDAIWVDCDNDGRLDLATFCDGRLLLLRNELEVPPGHNVSLGPGAYNGVATQARQTTTPPMAMLSASGRGHLMQGPPTILLPALPDTTSASFAADHRMNGVAPNAEPSDRSRGEGGRAATLAILPNPFSGETMIRLELPQTTAGRVAVTSMDGTEVALLIDGELIAGRYDLRWNPRAHGPKGHPGGTYLVIYQGGGERLMERVVYVK